MSKSRDAFRTISEVATALDTPAHVLRFWESKFTQVKPVKRAGGRRYYRPGDVELLAGIKQLLHDDGMTIKGAQKLMREQGVKHVAGLGSVVLNTEVAIKTAEPAINLTPENARKPVPSDAAEPIDTVNITNIVPLPAVPAQSPKVSLDLSAKTSEPGTLATPAVPKDLNIPADPSDADSKAPARLFHLLHKASHEKLAARANAIAPLLDRMQVLRNRIATR